MCGKIVNKEVQYLFKLKGWLTRTLFKDFSLKEIPNKVFDIFLRIGFRGRNSNISFTIMKFKFLFSKIALYFSNRPDH